MGWTYTNKGSLTTKEYFERAFNYDKPEEGRSGKVIAFSATWRVAYMAYEVITKGERKVIALVCLIHHVPNARDGYTFGYKDMDESMGPCESRCPESILKLLTPTEYEYAIAWRQRCWDRINKRKAAPKIKEGDWVKFKVAITFTNGAKEDKFQWVKGNKFRIGWDVFRISKWREREYEKVP